MRRAIARRSVEASCLTGLDLSPSSGGRSATSSIAAGTSLGQMILDVPAQNPTAGAAAGHPPQVQIVLTGHPQRNRCRQQPIFRRRRRHATRRFTLLRCSRQRSGWRLHCGWLGQWRGRLSGRRWSRRRRGREFVGLSYPGNRRALCDVFSRLNEVLQQDARNRRLHLKRNFVRFEFGDLVRPPALRRPRLSTRPKALLHRPQNPGRAWGLSRPRIPPMNGSGSQPLTVSYTQM